MTLSRPSLPIPRPEYPRPQFERREWASLNGSWEFDFDDARQGLQAGWHSCRLRDRIVVPFPYQSEMSGINDKGIHEVVWYSRTFEVPPEWRDRDLLLNFGAVDYRTTVWVNGQEVGHNRGGHVPFSFDISPYLNKGPRNRVTLRVEDKQDPYQPRGKQSTTGLPHHIDYYCTTGIWQSVWLEPVPAMRIDSLRITPVIEQGGFELWVNLHAPSTEWRMDVDVLDGDTVVSTLSQTTRRAAARLFIRIPDAKLWSPDSPHLYTLKLRLSDTETRDEVTSYVGMRSVELKDGRILLNGSPIFLKMILDQGYWPQSYLAAPSDDALRFDVEVTKQMGFNGARKHQKIEDPRWTYWCDKLGLLVWDEMPNARAWSPEAEEHLTAEWERAVRRDINSPSVIAWVPVNESMGFPGLQKSHPGQYSFLERIVGVTRRLDPERPVIDNDGWEHTDITDILAIHDYTPTAELLRARYEQALRGGALPANAWDADKPIFVRGSRFRGQPVMLTEVGGFLMERSDLPKEKWDLLYAAYGTTFSPEDLLAKYADLMAGIAALPFVSGFCYTQLTDIEQEMNGLLTYDRVPKIDPKRIAAIHRLCFDERAYPPPAAHIFTK